MHCAEFERRLNELLDERQPPEADAALAAHAVLCPQCESLLVKQELLLEGVAGLRSGRPPIDLAASVLAAWQSRPTPTSRRFSWRWLSLAIAASVIVAGGITLWNGNRAQPGVPGNPPPMAVRPAQPNPAVNGEMMAFVWPWPDHAKNVADDNMTQLDWAPDLIDGVTNGIRPLTQSMGAAIETLRDSIPTLANSG